jgi:hypothetical protein
VKRTFYPLFLLASATLMTCLMLKPWVEHFRSRNWPTRDVTNATLLTHTWPTARGQRTETSCRFEIALDRYSLQVTQRLAFGIDRCEHARSPSLGDEDGVSRARQRARALKAFLSPKDGHGLAVQALGIIAFPQALMSFIVRGWNGIWPPAWTFACFIPFAVACFLALVRRRRQASSAAALRADASVAAREESSKMESSRTNACR